MGVRNNPGAERRVGDLLAAWRAAGRPVVHVQHAPLRPHSPLRAGGPGHAFKPEARPLPGERIVFKHGHSAFAGIDLEARLRAAGARAVVVVGLTTDHCVSSTARAAAGLGFAVTVVEDATATFDRVGPDGTRYDADIAHRVALACLHGEFGAGRAARDLLAGDT